MTGKKTTEFAHGARIARLTLLGWLVSAGFAAMATAAPGTVNVTVKSPTASGDPVTVGYRWLLEEDSTYAVTPGDATTIETLGLNLHKSHMTVVAQGHAEGNASGLAAVPVPDTSKRYFLSILPDQHDSSGPRDCQVHGTNVAAACFTQSGRRVTPELFGAGNSANLTIAVAAQPVPTAQIYLRAFVDSAPINGVWDNGETPLGGWSVFFYDMGGQLNADTFGNPIGTVYYDEPDASGNPRVRRLGDGTIHTMTAAEVNDPERNPYGLEVGDALIKNIAPGKYGVQVVPPQNEGWQQTSTIEGTKGLDVWVKADEPRFFAEFGAAGHHAEFGFINPDKAKSNLDPGNTLTGTHTLTGRVVNMHMSRPPNYTFYPGHPLPGCWVGLNDSSGTQGLYAAPCDDDSVFTIPRVPNGSYQLVLFDKYLDNVIGFQTVVVGGAGSSDALGDIPVFRWFGSQDHYVFNDLNGDGIWNPATEKGMPDQAVNLRFRDGSIYASSTTDGEGYLPFDEVFPFFSFLVAEVDFARYKATSVQVTVDAGGPVVDNAFGRGKLTPQLQAASEATPGSGGQSRLEKANWSTNPDDVVAPPLLEGFNTFLGTTNVFEWGKQAYPAGENGGITGVVYYQTTRAESDPRFAAPETWEPGIPRVQVALYRADPRGHIYLQNGSLSSDLNVPTLADVDNYPLCWNPDKRDPAACGAQGKGPEDVDYNANGSFDLGDALSVSYTDSWDDSQPSGCPDHNPPLAGQPDYRNDQFYRNGKCYDGLRNFGQVRPAVFDGGYAFGKPFDTMPLNPGYYVVQASTPRGVVGVDTGNAQVYGDVYQIQQEEDKNVDFGDTMKVSKQALPQYCVGGLATDGSATGTPAHEAGTALTLFGGVPIDSRYQGTRPGCDFRLVQVADGKNAAADFFMFTETPVTGHIQGFVLNDLANEFNQQSPNFGEKMAPSWIPVSVRDYVGNEVYHTYTDRWGNYNAIVPSAYRINTPMPSGVSPNMLQVCLNAPVMQDANGNWVPEPHHNKQYTQFCYTLDFKPGQTTYLDTPVLPVAAFVGPGNWQCDCEYPSGTPVINYATIGNAGPYIADGGSRTLTIYSRGTVNVLDPLAIRADSTVAGGINNAVTVPRDFGFGATAGQVWIGNTPIPAANVTWAADGMSIVVNVPAGVRTGQLRIVRSNNKETVHGLTVTIDQPGQTSHVLNVLAGQSIQAQIDAANPGDIVMVQPGMYLEMLVMTKPIRLQGWGASATVINPVQSPTEKIAQWRIKLNNLANCTHEIGLLPGQENNVASATAPCGFTPGTGLFLNEEGAGILVAPTPGKFGTAAARIDGFSITGSDQSGGVVVNGYATGLEISNNVITNNQGPYAAGIRIGQPLTIDPATGFAVDAQNDFVRIHHNHVAQNGGLFEAGAGIGLYTGSDNYSVTRNYVCGNYAAGDGAGVAHYGFSSNGVIADNSILFNQAFDQTVGTGGNGGGVLVAGYAPPAGEVTPGAGSVNIDRNLIQGNNAGSANGGGIALQFLVASGTANVVNIRNNMVVNNVAGFRAGGIWMDSADAVLINNNTIVNNDTTATAALAFGGCVQAVPSTRSCPQVAGVYSAGGTIGSDNAFRNNIILGNRAFHWAVTGGVGNLVLDGFADLGGTGLYSSSTSPIVGIQSSLLGNANALVTSNYYPCTQATARNNSCVGGLEGATGIEATHFRRTYWNGPPSTAGGAGGTNYPPEGNTLANLMAAPVVAAATDEGGNFIDVHYGPLSRVQCYLSGTSCTRAWTSGAAETLSDYHLRSTASSAINLAQNSSAPSNDFDQELRPRTTGNPADRGADEYYATAQAAANVVPVIAPIPLLQNVLGGSTYRYQVLATDANGDRIIYSLLIAPAGMTIDADTGLISYTPTFGTGNAAPAGCIGTTTSAAAICAVTVRASDGVAIPVLQPIAVFGLTVQRNRGVPAAAAAAPEILVNTTGIFSLPAPGVLAAAYVNNPNGVALTAALVADNTAAAGKLTLGADGAVQFIPSADWVGTASFTYTASDGANASAPLAAALRRDFTVVSARYVSGEWRFTASAVAALNGRTVTIVRDRAGPGSELITTGTVPVISGGTWSYTRVGGPNYQTGDTVTVSVGGGGPVLAAVLVLDGEIPQSTAYVQCPGDTNGDGVSETPGVACKHLAAGDGYIRLADDKELYTFGFSDVTGVPQDQAITKGILNAQFPAPTLVFNQGDKAYVTLTNVGMIKRPDLFDPHSVHFHGFPNASAVFDGVPESSITINMGYSITYFYDIREPGTYMYHCHVEAAEHMQMGMLGNLYVRPKQNGTSFTFGGKSYTQFAYNDGDGSTGYDVEYPIQIGSMDSVFHDEHIAVQPLPFAEMRDDYGMLNGRGYPQTVSTANIDVVSNAVACGDDGAIGEKRCSGVDRANESSQKIHSLVTATAGQKVLLRLSNLNVTRFYTLAVSGGLSMKVVGTGAHILRGPDGQNLYYDTNSVTLGGGETADVIIDTDGVSAGTYLLYATDLEALSNGESSELGGMMTEIRIQ